ncbi:MAG: HEAT repeat domain-containing protein [Prochloraceae cyanobacterium]
MEIEQIKTYLNSEDARDRLKGLTELRKVETDSAVPLLLTKIKDKEFLVRSFVAMGLGRKRNSESYAALLELIKFDRDPNVRAEAANSLSFYGQVAATHLVSLFTSDSNWLVRRSILAAMVELNCPEELFEICLCGLAGEDFTVREASIEGLAFLANSVKKEAALEELLRLVDSEFWRLRVKVATALGKFDDPRAKEALNRLREDENSRVVGAAMESLV